MHYRTLGRTGLKVSQLGFGAMRLPMMPDGESVDTEKSVGLIHRAFEAGVNYIDSAVFYCKADSQRAARAIPTEVATCTRSTWRDQPTPFLFLSREPMSSTLVSRRTAIGLLMSRKSTDLARSS